MGLIELLEDLGRKKDINPKLSRRSFLAATAAALASTACPPKPPPPNGVEYKILTKWRANYTLEGTEANGQVRYYSGGTYDPETNQGTWIANANLGQEVELGTALSGQTKSFDVVVEADDGLRKVYKNVAMSGTQEYYDNTEGVLKLTDFNLEDYIHKWLDPRNEGIRVINRWNQDTIAAEFNPDIAVTSSGQTLFNMVNDFMPSKDDLRKGMTYKQALERGVNKARNILGNKKYIALYDGSDVNNRESLIKWADYLKRNIGNIEVKELSQAKYEGLDKLKAQGYEILDLEPKRLSDEFIDEIIKWLQHVKSLSNGVIQNFTEDRMGNRTAADLANIPDGASWSFYDSVHNIGNGTYPPGGDVVKAHNMRYNSDRASLAQVRHETFDAFFRKDQDVDPANIEDWIKFSFTRPAAGAEGHKITENYETRNSLPSSVSVQSGALQVVNDFSYSGNDTLSRMGNIFGPKPEEGRVRNASPRGNYTRKKREIKK